MRAIPCVVLVALAAFFAGGCANSRVELSLDLYQRDLKFANPLTPEQLARYQRDLADCAAGAPFLAEDRKKLADDLFEAYRAIADLEAQVAFKDPAKHADVNAISSLRASLADYHNIIDAKQKELQDRIKVAQDAIIAYGTKLDTERNAATTQPWTKAKDDGRYLGELELNGKIQDAAIAAAELSGPFGSDFEKALPTKWQKIQENISEDNLARFIAAAPETNQKALNDQAATLRARAERLSQTLDTLHKQGRIFAKREADELNQISKDSKDGDTAHMRRAVSAIAKAATSIPSSLGWGDRGGAGLSDLSQSSEIFYTQIDRLQDPADPAWRIVSDPHNRHYWGTQFSRTYFYSEGNSSTVIVRDNPISYRVQNGRNNPAALVKGQLEISRALASAAITVAGAATGVPLPKLPSFKNTLSTETPTTAPSADSGSTDAQANQDLGRRRATVERETAARKHQLRTLSQHLRELRDQFNQPTLDDKKKVMLLADLQATLTGYKAMLSPDAVTPATQPTRPPSPAPETPTTKPTTVPTTNPSTAPSTQPATTPTTQPSK